MRRKRSKPTSTVMAEIRDSNAMRKVPRSCWSEEAEEGFVVLWQQHPCLFDVSSSHFHNKDQKEKAWRDIADCLQQPVEEVKTRAASLRTQFSRLIKPRPGNEAKPLTPRQQWLLRVMDFIKPYIVHRPCEITLDMPLRDLDDSEEQEDHSDSLEFSPFTKPETQAPSTSASKSKHEPDWLAFLREFQEREEEREKRAEEREDRRQREFLEREERRERERREEERKHNERRDREWREWMESLLKEERRERDEREKESRAREDRLMKMIELFLMKK
ncbi:trichohyalin-like [Solea solea]|uniref:trichohyalin-like n=1 Tax=Solea solea TaxID=90069 RepID=UPI00272D8F8E|nr:trichohyalin-like [Solea solea]